MAEQVTGLATGSLTGTKHIGLADSALHAPQASFSGHEFYPALHDKAAVLVSPHLESPATRGNKRAAWAALAMFFDLNAICWDPDPPQVDAAEAAMQAIAASQVDETWVAHWLRERPPRFSQPTVDPQGR